MMPAHPMPPLIRIKAQLLLQFPVVEFDAPAGLGEGHPAPNVRRLRGEGSQPIRHGLHSVLGPFPQQPRSHPRWVVLRAPSRGRPDVDHATPRACQSSTSLTSGHALPSRGRKFFGYRVQMSRSRQRLQWRLLEGAAGLLGRRPRQVRIFGLDASPGLDLDDRRPRPLPQGWANPNLMAVEGIRHQRPWGHRPTPHLVDQLQGPCGLPPVGGAERPCDVGSPVRIADPGCGQIQSPVERTTGLGTTPMQAHGDLAARPLAPRATVLPRHCHRRRAGFGASGFLNAPHVRLLSSSTTFRANRRGTVSIAQGRCPTPGRRACPSAPAMRPAIGSIDWRSPSSDTPLPRHLRPIASLQSLGSVKSLRAICT